METPAESVVIGVDDATVNWEDGSLVGARRATLAVPRPALREIERIPTLNAAQQALVEELQFRQAKNVAAVSSTSPNVHHRVAVCDASLSNVWRTEDDCLTGITYEEHTNADEETRVADLVDVISTTSAVDHQSVTP